MPGTGGFEADDLIATYVRQTCDAGANATIVSSDKDLMQLVNDCVVMYDTMKDRKIGISEVIEKFGVPPEKVVEVQALIGDSTDNVPGVPGIGVKTAAQLISEFGDLETLLVRAAEIKQEKRRQALIENAEVARLSKKLVALDAHVQLEVPIADLAVHEPDYKRLIAFLKAMEFSTLTRRVAEFSGIDAGAIAPDGRLRVGGDAAPRPGTGATPRPFPAPRKRAQRAWGEKARRASANRVRRARRQQSSSRRGRWRQHGSRPRAMPRSTARATRSCAASNSSMPGSRARAISARLHSTPRPPASIRCKRCCAAFRSRSQPTKPAMCRLPIGKAATPETAACSPAQSRQIRSRSAQRSRR